jgi:acyl carrier protein phosphodiesterase
MNYLAHAWLSFNQPEILVGNMISDFVKGKKRFSFSERIQQGIMLHRSIDEFTDAHDATKKAKQFLKPVVGSICRRFYRYCL